MAVDQTQDFKLAVDDERRMHASGAITFANAAQTLARLPLTRGNVDVNLSGLANADSATLAVLIAWAARSREHGAVLSYRDAPAGLRNLARLSDLEGLLLGAEVAA